jgi:hypothetical protein
VWCYSWVLAGEERKKAMVGPTDQGFAHPPGLLAG